MKRNEQHYGVGMPGSLWPVCLNDEAGNSDGEETLTKDTGAVTCRACLGWLLRQAPAEVFKDCASCNGGVCVWSADCAVLVVSGALACAENARLRARVTEVEAAAEGLRDELRWARGEADTSDAEPLPALLSADGLTIPFPSEVYGGKGMEGYAPEIVGDGLSPSPVGRGDFLVEQRLQQLLC